MPCITFKAPLVVDPPPTHRLFKAGGPPVTEATAPGSVAEGVLEDATTTGRTLGCAKFSGPGVYIAEETTSIDYSDASL